MSDLPGFWRFVWLFWMQPVTLHRFLRSVGVDARESGWKLLRRQRSLSENWWRVRSVQMLLLVAPGVLLGTGLIAGRHVDVNWFVGVGGVAIGAAFYLAGGVAFGHRGGDSFAGQRHVQPTAAAGHRFAAGW